VPFPERMLTGIIFGSKTPANIVNEFIESTKNWSLKPKFFAEQENQAKHKQIFEIVLA
jgi:hypothetical protein